MIDNTDDEFNEDDSYANAEIIEATEISGKENIVVYSRDWTIETVFNQIKQAN